MEHQEKVDEVKSAILEQIKVKNPRLWYQINYGKYEPWKRTDNIENKIEDLKLNRNDKCPCGSGKKVKNCCDIRNYYTIPKIKQNGK